MKRIVMTILLLALAAPCNASPLLFLMQGGNQAFIQGQINGITAISNAGPITTGTQSGILAAGNITVYAEVNSPNIDSGAIVTLTVDGASCDSVFISGGGELVVDTLTCAVSAGEHSVQVSGGVTESGTFIANTFTLPLP